MITINLERCDGCGECMAFCPDGAIYLVDGGAVVDHTLCRECEACIAACPTEAIVITEQVQEQTPVPNIVPTWPGGGPEPEVIRVEPEATPVLRRAGLLPMVGTALIWTAREIVPRLAEYWLASMDRRLAQQRATDSAQHTSKAKRSRQDIDPQNGRCGSGRRHRRGRRGN